MDSVVDSLSFMALGPVLLAAWLDLRHRRVPMGLILAVVLLAFLQAGAKVRLDLDPDPATVAVVLVFVSTVAAWALGLIATADAAVAGAGAAVVLASEPAVRPFAVWGQVAGSGAALALYVGHRAIVSLRVSGPPHNLWDLLALTKGRSKTGCHLGDRGRPSWLLDRLEAFRTPDGLYLSRAAYPFITCLAAGYVAILVAVAIG